MTFQALLVSSDDHAAAVLAPVLSEFGLEMRRCTHADAILQLAEKQFDAILVDFDEPEAAVLVLQNAYTTSPHSIAVSVALLREHSRVRNAFGAGAHFVLYKPLNPAQAQASLRAATILIKRERRRSLRVPVQAPVQVRVQGGLQVEGILLDLSQDGLELLASQPLCPSAGVSLQFSLPASADAIDAQAEIAWANPNGQCGVRFVNLPETVRATLASWVAANARKSPAEDAERSSAYTLTDLSSCGCYLETESPFPERSGVGLRLAAAGMEVVLQGMVRVMHPGFGMGIEFAARSVEDRETLDNFIRFLLSSSSAAPPSTVTPLGLASGMDPDSHPPSEYDDPLLDLLRRREQPSQEDFLRELHQQRGTTAALSSC
jgi:CheY-like chemotaxis protein